MESSESCVFRSRVQVGYLDFLTFEDEFERVKELIIQNKTIETYIKAVYAMRVFADEFTESSQGNQIVKNMLTRLKNLKRL